MDLTLWCILKLTHQGAAPDGAESDIDDCLILLELSLIEVDSHFNLLSSFQCFNTLGWVTGKVSAM